MDKETNNKVFKIYQENKHGHLTPFALTCRRSKWGKAKPKRKDHR